MKRLILYATSSRSRSFKDTFDKNSNKKCIYLLNNVFFIALDTYIFLYNGPIRFKENTIGDAEQLSAFATCI